ncbi:MAG: hypothetical protein WCH00_03115 [Candidatus Saccharibacteria bacterium]
MSKSRKTSSRGFLFQKLIGIAILILAFIATLTPQKALAAYWWDSGSKNYILYSFNIPSYDKGPLWYLNQTKDPADSTTSGCTQSPASTAWLSDNTEFTADQTVSVKSTDTSVNLKFNYAGITCRTEPSNSVSQNKATVTSAPNTDLVGQSVQTDFGVNSQPPHLVGGSTVFTYKPNGGFGGSSACDSVTATLKTCHVNVSYAAVDHFQYNNGGGDAGYTCVGDGKNFRTRLDDYKNNPAYPDCGITTVSLAINVSTENILSYPWLQSFGGDVSSQGGVSGQLIGQKGSRLANNASKEAQFVVTSETQTDAKLSKNFCSTNLLVLGVNAAGRRNCDTGGYKSSPIAFDSIYVSIVNAWESNGSGDSVKGKYCSPYGTSSVDAYSATSDFKTDISLGCPAGGIQLVGTDKGHSFTYLLNIPSGRTIKGNGTLLVIGNLYITSDIINSTISTNNPYDVPNLTIFVTGDVIVSPLVKELDASIIRHAPLPASPQDNNGYSIFTCKGGTACATNQLNVKGYMASSSNIVFNRRYTDASNNPAEIIKLTGQSIAFPSPGIDRSSSNSGVPDSLQINTDELPPRLK